MDDSFPPYEKRVEELRHGAAAPAAKKPSESYENNLEHTGILELDDDTFYKEQDYDTQENSPPKKGPPPPRRTSSLQGSPSPIHVHGYGYEPAPATPSPRPTRTSSLQGSPSPIHIHGNGYEPAPATPSPRPTRTSSLRGSPALVAPNARSISPLQAAVKSQSLGGKNVSFNEHIEVLERVEEQEEAPGAVEKPSPLTSILSGGVGFCLLTAYMFLLLLNGLTMPTLRFLLSAKLYTEVILFWLWCFALQEPVIAWWVFVPTAIGVTIVVLAGAIIVMYLAVCVGIVVALMWWVWMICMLFVPESQKLIPGDD